MGKSNTTRKIKKKITPLERLNRRINKEFPKKKLIGDISINDFEYSLLLDFLRREVNRLSHSYTKATNSLLFIVALVQIGIRSYDGNYWNHVAELLGVEKIPQNTRKAIANSINGILEKYDKPSLDKGEIVNNILMHGFVADAYLDNLFNFLFYYYRLDLERDINRNDTEMMSALIQVISEGGHKNRLNMIVHQITYAVANNPRGARTRIRWLLKLMDRCFWDGTVGLTSGNRLGNALIKWAEESEIFNEELKRYNTAGMRGKKRFTSPYLKFLPDRECFEVALPSQLIRTLNDLDSVRWKISVNDYEKVLDTEASETAIGYKSEDRKLFIPKTEIFSTITCELECDSAVLRTFKIKKDMVRFFDEDWELIASNKLHTGRAYAFTHLNDRFISEAIEGCEEALGMRLTSFLFQYGDVIKFPDGKGFAIGKKLEEGLLPRNLVNGVYAINNNKIDIYKGVPTVFLKMLPGREKGTLIKINDKKYRFFKDKAASIALNDRTGEIGYIIKLSDYGVNSSGLYFVNIDIPNDRKIRRYQFSYIDNFSFKFEGAPYIFVPRGTASFNNSLKINCNDNHEKVTDNTYNFEIEADRDFISFQCIEGNYSTEIHIFPPVLKWSFDNESWSIDKPKEIWYSEFPDFIYLKYPGEKINLALESEENDKEKRLTLSKSKAHHMFQCDTTRIRSWLNKEKYYRQFKIEAEVNTIEFLRVYTKSIVLDAIIYGDFQEEKLIGEFDIMGNSSYYADVLYNGSLLMDKEAIIDGKIQYKGELLNGDYEVLIYEEEEDDTGFGGGDYYLIRKIVQKIINPSDITGRTMRIKSVAMSDGSKFPLRLYGDYYISSISPIPNEKNKYKGILHLKYEDSWKTEYVEVGLEIFDSNNPRNIYLTLFDKKYDEYVEFLYDSISCKIVKEPKPGLAFTEQYRRYKYSLYPEDFIFNMEFTDKAIETYTA